MREGRDLDSVTTERNSVGVLRHPHTGVHIIDHRYLK